MTSITATIVIYDSAPDIAACLAAIDRQTRQPDEVVVFDNGSRDGGSEIARRALPGARIMRHHGNVGFSAGHNRAMAAAPADLHLVLNPDCQVGPSFVAEAVATLERHPDAGSLTGRLLRFASRSPDDEQPTEELADDILDSTGMVALRNRRVLDRGSNMPAKGRYLAAEYVFGASGAAAVYRRAMLEDVAFSGEPFDEAFIAYREDVDLAWRAQMRSWRCVYEPRAIARHRRRVAPGRRRLLPPAINRMSIANRWRMIAKNETATGWARDWHAIVGRDAATIAYCAVREQRTLAAVADVAGDGRRLRAWRRHVMWRRSAPDDDVVEWFGRREALPVDRLSAGAAGGPDPVRLPA